MKYVVVLKGYNVTLQRITFTFQEDSPYFLWLKVLPAAARPVLPVREADSSGARGTSGRRVTWSVSVGVGTSNSAESPVAALGVLRGLLTSAPPPASPRRLSSLSRSLFLLWLSLWHDSFLRRS